MKEGLSVTGRRLLARDSDFLSLIAGKLRWKGMTRIINVQWVGYNIFYAVKRAISIEKISGSQDNVAGTCSKVVKFAQCLHSGQGNPLHEL